MIAKTITHCYYACIVNIILAMPDAQSPYSLGLMRCDTKHPYYSNHQKQAIQGLASLGLQASLGNQRWDDTAGVAHRETSVNCNLECSPHNRIHLVQYTYTYIRISTH